MTRIGLAASGPLDPEAAGVIRQVIEGGGVVAYPTESFYALGASPWDARGIERILALKGERGTKPIPLVLASTAAILRVAAALPAGFDLLGRRFWPGPLTLVLAARPDLCTRVPAGSGTVGVRVPAHPAARELARIAGGALTSTSANRSGQPPPRTAGEVEMALGEDLDIVIDGGLTPGGLASTVLDLTVTPPRIVREGPVTIAALAAALGIVLEPPPGPAGG